MTEVFAVRFFEKYDDRAILGKTKEEIFAKILKERIEDTYDGSSDSIWYEDETEHALYMLNSGQAEQFMTSRIDYEYENWEFINLEEVR